MMPNKNARSQLSEPLLPQVRQADHLKTDQFKSMTKKAMSYPFSQAEVLSEEVSPL